MAMGQEQSSCSSSSLLHSEEPIGEEDEMIRAIMALTEEPMHSIMRSDSEQLAAMRAEAEKDYAEWRRQRRAMKKLARNVSSASTASSSFTAPLFHN
jgi:hypothetical protein